MLNNIYWLIPEIYLSLIIITLLVFFVIYSKINKNLNQNLKFIFLINYSLFICFLLYTYQLYLNINLQISLNILNLTPLIIFIKLILCLVIYT